MAEAGPPSFEMLKARARALVPSLRARAIECEELRRVPDESIAELHKSGLFRMLQPKRVGGSELPYRALVELGAILAEGCGSTSWVVANLASHHWMLAMWPEQAQDEVWGQSPDHLIGSALVFPSGKATAVSDGYVLSGRWPFSSGVDPSRWNFVGGIVHDAKDKPVEQRCFLVGAGDYRVIDTWYAAGLRGTGSKDIEMKDVFVPAHRTLPLTALVGGGTAPGCAINPAPLYKLPVLGLFAFVVSGVSLGLARGAIGDFTQQMHSRIATYSGRRLADLSNLQLKIGEASALADTAEALMLKGCDEAMAITEAGVPATIEQKARWRRDGAYAASLCTEAVNILFAATGGGGVYLNQPIQRAFRDAHAANAHYALSWDVNGTQWGRIALGLPAEAVVL
ncbi:MAG TPA: acyl-CoA dehydrogenase family protein [Stellaceae bacterium]|jgi:3-hydroxy-9,10-secoandrosta-1,3,5(10)-triene-9,17-dione monooxygenase